MTLRVNEAEKDETVSMAKARTSWRSIGSGSSRWVPMKTDTIRMLRAVEAERIEKMKVAVKRQAVFCWPPFIPMAPVVTKSAVT